MDLQARIDLVRSLAPAVEEARAEMERTQRLAPAVVEGLRSSGVMRAAVGADLDGPELDPIAQITLVEEFSRLDGAVGWCSMIAAASSFVYGFLEPEAGARWFGRPDACLAGQIYPTGRAERVDGGYRATGRFRFGSGINHATAVLAGCVVIVDGDVARHPDGRPELRNVLVEPSQVTILETWDTTGLRATGSHDYTLDDVFVPEHDSYDPTGPTRRDGPLYRYPPLFLAAHDGVPLGIARAAVDTVLELAGDKPLTAIAVGRQPMLGEHPQVQEAVAVAEVELEAARSVCRSTVAELWATLAEGGKVTRRQRGMYRAAMTWSHQTGRKVVEAMYDAAATSSIAAGSPLDRHLRDMATACQHKMVHPRIYGPAGRLLLGMSSGEPSV